MHNPASAINGLKGGRPQKYDRAQILALYTQGMTKDQIAAKLQCNWRTVHRVLTSASSKPSANAKNTFISDQDNTENYAPFVNKL